MNLNVDSVKQMFAFMKRGETLDEWSTRSLPILDGASQVVGYLTPLNALSPADERLVQLLWEWRITHDYAYPTRAPITPESTREWLQNSVIANESRLLFLVRDRHLHALGHLGLLISGTDIEIDNVLRGAPRVLGVMSMAMETLQRWALTELDAQELKLRVLGSNTHAYDFYTRLGYSEVEREAMAWVSEGERQMLRPSTTDTDDSLVTMIKNLQTDQQADAVILTAGPLIGVREAAFVLDATRYGWNSRHSEYLNAFQEEFAGFVGAEFALATSSCTGALHLALLALGIGPGDEVIVPETTWVATGSAVMYVGAKPIFADVDPATWTITPDTIRSVMTDRTKAVIPVHLYGYAAEMPEIMNLARAHDLFVVEDAAPAIGAMIAEKPVGTFGDFGAFSFQGAKMLVTGEGGMLVTDQQHLRDRAWKQQDHGRKPGTFWIEELGRKYKMSNTTAALGLAQLRSAQNQIDKKRRINAWYREFLSSTPGISFQEEVPGSLSICWMTSIAIDPDAADRASVVTELASKGIDSRPVFPAISQYPIWSRAPEPPQAAAAWIGRTAINLPSGVGLSRASVERVAEAIHEVMTRGG